MSWNSVAKKTSLNKIIKLPVSETNANTNNPAIGVTSRKSKASATNKTATTKQISNAQNVERKIA
jgi:hypothetical protein